jgi:hypothetical protein
MPNYVFSKPYYNVAPTANTIALEEAYNVYFEALPQGGFAIRKRPGLVLSEDALANTVSDGIYWSEKRQKVFFAAGGKIYSKASKTATPVEIGARARTGFPVVWAESQKLNLESVLYLACGDTLDYIADDEADVLTPVDASTPTSKFISNLNNRLYADTTSYAQDFYITDYNPDPAVMAMDPLFWTSSVNPFRATQKPDKLVGIYSGWNEIYLWGTQACEVWQEDGVTPVSPLVGSIIEAGLLAPYSVAVANNRLVALCKVGSNVAVVAINGRTPEILSEPIANRLQAMTTLGDAVGSICQTGGTNLYILTFPTEGETWVYDFKSDVWSQWSTWSELSANHTIFTGKFGVFASGWNTHYTQAANGKLYEITRSAFDDAGDMIRSSVRTGWIDHGTWKRKRSDQLIIKLQGYATSDTKIIMRHRSDGFPEWSNPIELEIQAGAQNDHFAKITRMGTYRNRQYEFIMTDASDLAIIGMSENLTRMGS